MVIFSFEPYRHEMTRLLKNFLKIKSVKSAALPNMPYGKGIFDALMFIQNTAEKMDIECVNLFGHMAYVDYGDGQEMLGILTHIDVVPEGDGWTMGAFEGIEKDGKIYGRGAIDNKGPAVAALYALKALNDNCVQLNKKVRLIFGADEESGWGDIEFYKKHEPMPDIAFSPDGEFPVVNAEKGLVHMELSLNMDKGSFIKSFDAGTRVNVVPNKAACVLVVPRDIIRSSLDNYSCPIGGRLESRDLGGGLAEITSTGKSAHGSLPHTGINAAASLLEYVGTLSHYGYADAGINILSEKIGTFYYGEPIELNISDESGRLTFNLGVLTIKDGVLKAHLDIRYPISYDKKLIDEKLEKHFPSFKIRCGHELKPHFVPEDSPLVAALKQAYTEVTGEPAYCKAVGGATYARAFENAVTFGPLFPGKPRVEHGPDEYIEIDTLMKNARIIANAIIKICG